MPDNVVLRTVIEGWMEEKRTSRRPWTMLLDWMMRDGHSEFMEKARQRGEWRHWKYEPIYEGGKGELNKEVWREVPYWRKFAGIFRCLGEMHLFVCELKTHCFGERRLGCRRREGNLRCTLLEGDVTCVSWKLRWKCQHNYTPNLYQRDRRPLTEQASSNKWIWWFDS